LEARAQRSEADKHEVRYDTTVVEGIGATFDALLDLLRGGPQVGKLVVDVR
jgi:NADPH-dependent curcumin reductase CurA